LPDRDAHGDVRWRPDDHRWRLLVYDTNKISGANNCLPPPTRPGGDGEL
jgi:hypothetical protein